MQFVCWFSGCRQGAIILDLPGQVVHSRTNMPGSQPAWDGVQDCRWGVYFLVCALWVIMFVFLAWLRYDMLGGHCGDPVGVPRVFFFLRSATSLGLGCSTGIRKPVLVVSVQCPRQAYLCCAKGWSPEAAAQQVHGASHGFLVEEGVWDYGISCTILCCCLRGHLSWSHLAGDLPGRSDGSGDW